MQSAGQAVSQHKRSWRHGQQLEPGRFAHRLVPGQDVLAQSRDQYPVFRRRLGNDHVIDHDVVGSFKQILGRLKVYHGRLVSGRNNRTANLLEENPLAGQTNEHRGEGHAGLLEEITQLLADVLSLVVGEEFWLRPNQGTLDLHPGTQGVPGQDAAAIVIPVEYQTTCQGGLLFWRAEPRKGPDGAYCPGVHPQSGPLRGSARRAKFASLLIYFNIRTLAKLR